MRLKNIGCYIFAFAVSAAAISGEQEQTALRKLYEDTRSTLQTWLGPKGEHEYLLSGKSGLNVGLTFEGDTPNEAKISLGAGRSLSAQSLGGRIVLLLFEGTGNDISITYDFDANGTWDGRLTRSGKREIFRDGQWQAVAEIKDFTTETPHAKVGDTEYEFSAGAWKQINK